MEPREQGDVRHRGEGHEGERIAVSGGGVDDVPLQVYRDPFVGHPARRRVPEVGHAVGAVHVAGVERLLEQWPGRPDTDRDVPAPRDLEA